MDLSLSPGQYELIYNLLSLTVATMLAAGIYFFGSRTLVNARYRPALLVSAIVVWIAGYHYWRISQSWEGAFTLRDGLYVASGAGFNDAYRYADWLITVPLLLVELVAVLALSKAQSRPLLRNLVIAAIAMIALGYPGEVATASGVKLAWWAAAMVPFVYILVVLYARLRPVIAAESPEVGGLIRLARNVLVVTWLFYPVSYFGPMLGLGGAGGEVALQVGYTVADLTAKAGFGLVILMIAKAKTAREQGEALEPQAAQVTTA